MTVGVAGHAIQLADRLAALLEDVANCLTPVELSAILSLITRISGYRYYMLAEIPVAGSKMTGVNHILASTPPDMSEEWQANNLLGIGCLAYRLRRETGPFSMPLADPEAANEATRETMRVTSLVYGVRALAVMPVSHPAGGRLVVLLLGDPPPLTANNLAALYLLAARICDRHAEILKSPGGHLSPLSDRERECLTWTAAGKTSNEIAAILNLSEHTINHYLNNAARKLGAVNRTQAVAYCLRNRWID